jgi:hypothetical protein
MVGGCASSMLRDRPKTVRLDPEIALVRRRVARPDAIRHRSGERDSHMNGGEGGSFRVRPTTYRLAVPEGARNASVAGKHCPKLPDGTA